MPLDTEVNLGPGDIVLDGDPAPPKRGTVPQFSTHIYCGQTARWIKMPLSMEVGPDDIVLDGAQLSPQRTRDTPPEFSAHIYCGQTVAYLSYCSALVEKNCHLGFIKIDFLKL